MALDYSRAIPLSHIGSRYNVSGTFSNLINAEDFLPKPRVTLRDMLIPSTNDQALAAPLA
jgi:hypothetical protein